MKSMNIKTLGVLILAAVLGGALLHTSQIAQTAADKLTAIEASVGHEQERIAVLEAEWQFLNSPQRLEKLAREYYGVSTPSTSQMIGGAEDFPFPSPIENMQGGGFQAASYRDKGVKGE